MQTVKTELATWEIILRGSHIVIPHAAQWQMLMLTHEGHRGAVKTNKGMVDWNWGEEKELTHVMLVNSTAVLHRISLLPGQISQPPAMADTQSWHMWTIPIRRPPAGTDWLLFTVNILSNPTSANLIKCLWHFSEFIVMTTVLYFLQRNSKHKLRKITRCRGLRQTVKLKGRTGTLCKAIHAAHSEGKDWCTEFDVFSLWLTLASLTVLLVN